VCRFRNAIIMVVVVEQGRGISVTFVKNVTALWWLMEMGD